MNASTGQNRSAGHKEPLRARINDLFFELWSFGSNALVSWSANRHGIFTESGQLDGRRWPKRLHDELRKLGRNRVS